jgi:ribonuclease HI
LKQVFLFSDGSALGNPGPGGYGTILRYNGSEKIVCGNAAHTTNNRMELSGVIEGLRALKEPCTVTIVSDSSYVVNAINGWLANWVKKNFKNVKNVDLWQAYLDVAAPHTVQAEWVRGHDGHEENERCDVIAKAEALKAKEQ